MCRRDLRRVTVTMSPESKALAEERSPERRARPRPGCRPPIREWCSGRRSATSGFGTGRNVRFGDLNGDGKLDVLIAQVNNHGPKDRNSEVGCLTAMTFDGKKLWQSGEPTSGATASPATWPARFTTSTTTARAK